MNAVGVRKWISPHFSDSAHPDQNTPIRQLWDGPGRLSEKKNHKILLARVEQTRRVAKERLALKRREPSQRSRTKYICRMPDIRQIGEPTPPRILVRIRPKGGQCRCLSLIKSCLLYTSDAADE